jgi:hypothetical protein
MCLIQIQMSANANPVTSLQTRSGLEIRGFDCVLPMWSAERILGQLCGAFEGGSNYWYSQLEIVHLPKGYEHKDAYEDGRLQLTTEYWHWAELVPVIPGGAVGFRVYDQPWNLGKEPPTCPKNYLCQKSNRFATVLLHRPAIRRGIKILAEKYPKNFAAILGGNDDAGDADAFLQCCAFGEVVYG